MENRIPYQHLPALLDVARVSIGSVDKGSGIEVLELVGHEFGDVCVAGSIGISTARTASASALGVLLLCSDSCNTYVGRTRLRVFAKDTHSIVKITQAYLNPPLIPETTCIAILHMHCLNLHRLLFCVRQLYV